MHYIILFIVYIFIVVSKIGVSFRIPYTYYIYVTIVMVYSMFCSYTRTNLKQSILHVFHIDRYKIHFLEHGIILLTHRLTLNKPFCSMAANICVSVYVYVYVSLAIYLNNHANLTKQDAFLLLSFFVSNNMKFNTHTLFLSLLFQAIQ